MLNSSSHVIHAQIAASPKSDTNVMSRLQIFAAAMLLLVPLLANQAAGQPQRTFAFYGLGQPGDYFGVPYRAQQVGISDSGAPLVYGVDDNGALFRWSPTDGVEPLVGNPGETEGIFIYDVTDDGASVVGNKSFDGIIKGILWTDASGIEKLTPLPGVNGARAQAYGIFPDGKWISGWSQPDIANASDLLPTVWSNPSSPQELDRIGGVGFGQQYVAFDVVDHNGDYWSAGTNSWGGGNSDAFVWKNEDVVFHTGVSDGTDGFAWATNVAVAQDRIRVLKRPGASPTIIEFSPDTAIELARFNLQVDTLNVESNDMSSNGDTVIGVQNFQNPDFSVTSVATVWEGRGLWSAGGWQANSLHDILSANMSLADQMAVQLADWSLNNAVGVVTRDFCVDGIPERVSAIVGQGTDPNSDFESFLATVHGSVSAVVDIDPRSTYQDGR